MQTGFDAVRKFVVLGTSDDDANAIYLPLVAEAWCSLGFSPVVIPLSRSPALSRCMFHAACCMSRVYGRVVAALSCQPGLLHVSCCSLHVA